MEAVSLCQHALSVLPMTAYHDMGPDCVFLCWGVEHVVCLYYSGECDYIQL